MNESKIEIDIPSGKKLILLERLSKREKYSDADISRNIYLFDRYGNLIWQIKTDYDAERMPFTSVYIDESGSTFAYRWDGGIYNIDLESGKAIPKKLLK